MTELDVAGEAGQRAAELLRSALMAAQLVAEQMSRQREQALRVATAATRGQVDQVRAQYDAERAIAVGRLSEVTRPQWWQGASREDIALAWQDAAAWRGVDPRAERYAQRIAEEARDRYGVDPDGLAVEVPAGRVTAQARRDDVAAQVEATVLLGAQDPDVGLAWDTDARRQALVEQLEAAGVHPEAVQARLLSDLAQGRPPVEAVQPGQVGASPAAAGRARGRGVVREPEHTAGR